jgi:hypothetical protein
MTDGQFLKTDDVRFVRDRRSTAILNIDSVGYKQFLKERERELQMKKMTEDFRQLQGEMTGIKELLQQLVNGLK